MGSSFFGTLKSRQSSTMLQRHHTPIQLCSSQVWLYKECLLWVSPKRMLATDSQWCKKVHSLIVLCTNQVRTFTVTRCAKSYFPLQKWQRSTGCSTEVELVESFLPISWVRVKNHGTSGIRFQLTSPGWWLNSQRLWPSLDLAWRVLTTAPTETPTQPRFQFSTH